MSVKYLLDTKHYTYLIVSIMDNELNSFSFVQTYSQAVFTNFIHV